MTETNPILRVAVFSPVPKLFDYLSPKVNESASTPLALQPGLRVQVPFGRSQRMGVVLELAQSSECDLNQLKCIDTVLDSEPVFSPLLLKLLTWASDYYQGGLGEVMELALPGWLRKGNSMAALEAKMKIPSLPQGSILNSTHPPTHLNAEQQQAVHAIACSLNTYKTFLLQGVTGSGKTEVYMQVIEQCLAQNLQALVLVPEIGLTPQMLARFQARFAVPIAVLHSSISEKKRAEAWAMARSGLAPIVLGTRSAVFTPLKAAGIFILDEEHDLSFKQQDGFRYSARDLIIMRAYLEQCPIVLGSASPSLESIQNARTGRYQSLILPNRAGSARLPKVDILDIRHKKLDEGLSAQLIASVQKHLDEKGQVLLFLNRRGFAPVLICFDCGFIAECPHCDSKLTLHYQLQKLRCHHCDFSCKIYDRCPSCSTRNLSPLGVGTERVEAALKRYFPKHTILRIDRDSTRRKGKMEEALDQIQNQEAHILLGTQMLAKGHHFPHVTLVGILDIDQALFSYDFRSSERLGQLITQVAGRAGRAERAGQVLLQSCHPEHPLLKILLEKGYSAFADHLLLERRSAALPPFSYQILMRSEAKNSGQSLNFLKNLKEKAQRLIQKQNWPIHILGPVMAPMEKKEGKYRGQLLLQSAKRSSLQNLTRELLGFIEQNPAPRSLRWSLDVDPLDMF